MKQNMCVSRFTTGHNFEVAGTKIAILSPWRKNSGVSGSSPQGAILTRHRGPLLSGQKSHGGILKSVRKIKMFALRMRNFYKFQGNSAVFRPKIDDFFEQIL